MTLGYTSSRQPASAARTGRTDPRIPDDTNASTAPVCAPVIRPVRKPRGFSVPFVITRIDSAAARIHSGRSTTRAGGTAPSVTRPVTSRTGGSAFAAALRQLVDRLAAGVVGGRRPRPGQPLADGGRESPVDGGTDGQIRRRASSRTRRSTAWWPGRPSRCDRWGRRRWR